ncbi:MAG TPA: FixH family protein [Cytophagaceae bacterium]
MKLNWGFGIVIVFSCFVVFIVSLVIRTYSVNTDLVADDYYAKEIAYQDQIDKMSGYSKLDGKVIYESTSDAFVITYPFASKPVQGNITFFRPSDKQQDLTVKIETDSEGKQYLKRDLFLKGLYRMQVDFQVDGKKYFVEEAVIIN